MPPPMRRWLVEKVAPTADAQSTGWSISTAVIGKDPTTAEDFTRNKPGMGFFFAK